MYQNAFREADLDGRSLLYIHHNPAMYEPRLERELGMTVGHLSRLMFELGGLIAPMQPQRSRTSTEKFGHHHST